MKQLPTGLQVFETIRKGDGLYVDKTDIIYNWVSAVRKQYFISRPRRFDKSLLCWTLDALFRGKRELFEGLAISKTDWKWESYPVIHLNMSHLNTANGVDGVRKSLIQYTKSIADECGIDLRGEETLPGWMLREIYVGVAEKYGKGAVIIIDEYDTPFLDFYNNPQSAQEVRAIMMNYYGLFKSHEQYIEFLFMTGISKFTQDWVSSQQNNIHDISIDEKFGTLLGYTDKELVENFGEHIEAGAKKLNISVDELTEKIRNYYYGFCFDGTNKVYCPFSILNFFHDYQFIDHWTHSGSIKIIADYMKDRGLTVEQFRGMEVPRDYARKPGEIETARPESFLYQAGYLTLREGYYDDYSFDYPNTAVLNSMSELATRNIVESAGGSYLMEFRNPLLRAVRNGDAKCFVETVNRLLAIVPYDDYAKSAKSVIRLSRIPESEWLYRAAILSFLQGCGVVAFGEPLSRKGRRSDLLICYSGSAWVVEIKVAYDDDCKAKADEALKQITDKQYDAPYNNAKRLGVAIDDKTRQIGEWVEG